MKRTELLAPAKDKDTAFAAIDCGADAVYLGPPAFGARKAVPNSFEDIEEVVNYAHKYWTKVFITLNTILTDNELEKAVEIAKKLDKIGVDALIVQDLGLLNKLIKLKLRTPIHMSTQCDNYLPQKIRFFNSIGVQRVVLARELSLEQIKKIHLENPTLELEAFIHGALCVSMSGQCYLSQNIGGRSANRGECAQPCRKKYSVETIDGKVIKKDFYALCLKDFNASHSLDKLIGAGIYSFKIEGRLKDIGYVKNIVSYYRKLLGKGVSSGKSFYTFTPNPEKSFNRGFTEYFLNGRTDCYNQISPKSRGEYIGEIIEVKKGCFKIKTDKKINPQDGVYCNENGFLINKVETSSTTAFPLEEGTSIIYPNKSIKLNIGDKLWRNFDVEFEKELSRPIKRQIAIDVKITDIIEVQDEDGITITKNIPLGEKANNPQKMKETFIKQFSKTGDSDFYINELTIKTELPFMPVSEINRLRRELFSDLIAKRLDVYREKIQEKQKPMNYATYYEKEVDYRANVHNSEAKDFYEKCGVNVIETSFENKKPQRAVALMHCKHCIKYALNMCKSPQNLVLKDEKGSIYPLKFDCKNCEMFIMSN